MRKKLYIILVLFIGIFCSCQDFLTVESTSKLTEEEMYATESDAYRAIMGIYAAIAHNSVYGQQVSTYFGYNTDIEYGHGNASVDDDRHGLWDYTCTPANSEMSSFSMMYTAINRANECISALEKSTLLMQSDPEKPSLIRNIYGEAKAIRALMYLELTRNWGDVPFKTEPTMHGDNFYIGTTDRDEILSYLIDDLKNAEPSMLYAAEISERVERFNRGAVQGLIARMALTRGGWSLRPDLNNPSAPGEMKRPDDYLKYYEIARDYCKKLIESKQHSLGTSYKEVFYNQCQEVYPSNGDMLYEVALALNYSGAIGHNIGVRIGANTQNPYGYSNVYYYASPTYMASFDPADTRRDVTFVPYEWKWNGETQRLEQNLLWIINVPISKWSKLDMKTPQGAGATYNTGINWPVIRFADVLLMYAEAENELSQGPTEEAKEALKTVRRRAFPESMHTTLVDQYVDALNNYDTFFDAIVEERAWEFGGESIRKYDLIRWNLLAKKLRQLKGELFQLGYDCQHPDKGGKYANAPAYLYYKALPDGTLDIVGMDQNMPTPPSGYIPYSWFRNVVQGTTEELVNNYDRYYREYIINADPLVYIYPIHKDVISESKGALKNYYGK